MLLDVVTLARDISRNHPTGGQAHTSSFPLARIGLLGARDADLEAYAFQLRALLVGQGGGDGVTSALGFTASS